MSSYKKNASKKTTPNATGTNTAASGDKKMDLGAFRSNFDGLKDVAAKLPEGKQKNAILTGIEDLYYWTVSAFKGITPPMVEA